MSSVVPAVQVPRGGSENRHPAGRLHWAAWLPEVINALVVAVPVFFTSAAVVTLYSDASIREGVVDTYKSSAWNVMGVTVFALLGIVFALITRFAADSSRRRRLALYQMVLLVTCMIVVGYQHHRLMKRITAMTGQTFGGFP